MLAKRLYEQAFKEESSLRLKVLPTTTIEVLRETLAYCAYCREEGERSEAQIEGGRGTRAPGEATATDERGSEGMQA